MHSLFQHRGGHFVLLTATASLLFFWNLGGATLWDLDEGRNATCAGEMFLSGNWVVPTFNGELRDHKPALLYWLQILCYQLGGMTEVMARLPSALAALLTLFVAYELGRGMFSKTTGLLSCLAAATSPMLIGAARFANPDALLNLFTALTLLFFWNVVQRPSVWTFLLMGASTGMAVLAKGPIGILLPAAVGFLFLVWERRWTALFDRRILWSLLAFILVAAPWYVLVGVITHAHFLTGFLVTHNFDRFVSTMENHRGSILYYPIVIFLGSLPWSLFAAGTIWTAICSCVPAPGRRWQNAWEKAADPSGRGGASAYRFLMAWVIVYVAFFSLSATKLPNYVLPVIVPWAVLTARFLDRWRKETLALPSWYLTCAALGLALIGVATGVGLALVAGVGEAAFMRNRFLPDLLPFAAVGFVPIAAAGVLYRALRTDRRPLFIRAFLFSAIVLLSPLAAWATAALNRAKAPASLAQTPAGRTDVDQHIVAYDMGRLPSLNFYLRRDVTHAPTLGAVAIYLSLPLPTFALLPEECLEEFQRQNPGLASELGRHWDMYRGANIVLLANSFAAADGSAAKRASAN